MAVMTREELSHFLDEKISYLTGISHDDPEGRSGILQSLGTLVLAREAMTANDRESAKKRK